MEALEKRIADIEDAIKMAGLATKEVLTFEDTARYTGFSKSYLYKLTSLNVIPFYKPHGKCIYFNRKELENWLLRNKNTTNEEIESQAIIRTSRMNP